jgi:uncharacterized protein (DUF2249 family)
MKLPVITPKIKIAEMLNVYPQLEDLMVEISPDFKKLKNPILRNTVARVTTLEQAVKIAGLQLGEVINKIRAAVGQDTLDNVEESPEGFVNDFSQYDENEISIKIDARPLIENGEHPLDLVIKKLAILENGKFLELITPFLPIPLIEIARQRNAKVMAKKISDNEYRVYFVK